MSIKLEAGKMYVTRSDEVVGPLETTADSRYPFCYRRRTRFGWTIVTWTEDGKWSSGCPIHDMDIVSEYSLPQPETQVSTGGPYVAVEKYREAIVTSAELSEINHRLSALERGFNRFSGEILNQIRRLEVEQGDLGNKRDVLEHTVHQLAAEMMTRFVKLEDNAEVIHKSTISDNNNLTSRVRKIEERELNYVSKKHAEAICESVNDLSNRTVDRFRRLEECVSPVAGTVSSEPKPVMKTQRKWIHQSGEAWVDESAGAYPLLMTDFVYTNETRQVPL